MTLLINLFLATLTLTFNSHARGVMAMLNCTCISEGGRTISADCSHLGWTEIPKDLPQTLLTLNMSSNLLTSLPGSSMVKFSVLETLDLSGNRIEKLDNQSFSGLSCLRWLSLRGNLLVYSPESIPDEVFKDLSRLTYLNLQKQPRLVSPELKYPDVALQHLRSLKTLKMDGLANNVDLGPGFAGLWELERLEISDETGHCAFKELSETFFSSINTSRSLTLNLTGCDLRKVHNNTFSFLPTLHNLDLFDCRHFHLDAFMEASKSLRWTQIKVLNISYTNKGTRMRIRAEHFKYLGYTWLEHFQADGIEIYTIDLGAIFNLPTSLKYLSFFDNHLINATFLYGLFGLPHLETIQVSQQNNFTSTLNINDLQGHTTESRKTRSVKTENNDAVRVREVPHKAISGGKRTIQSNVAKNNQITLHSTSKTLKHVAPTLFNNAAMNDKQNSYTRGKKKPFEPVSLYNFHHDHEDPYESMQTQKTVLSPGTTSAPKRFLLPKAISPLDNKRGVTTAHGHKLRADLSSCLNSQYRKTEEERLYTFLNNLKSFLLENHIQSQIIISSAMTSGRRETTALLIQQKGESVKTLMDDKQRKNGWSKFHDDRIPLPPSIKYAYGSDANLNYILPRLEFLNNSIEVMDLSKNRLPCFIGPWLGLHKLRHFDLSRNFAGYVGPYFFQGMSSLTHLSLHNNFLCDSFARDTEGQILSGLQNLEVLNLNENYIKHLSESAFQNQKRLKSLHLARNAMPHFKTRLSHMPLTFVDLSDNSLAFLGPEMREDLDTISQQSKNLTVDLYGNDLSCGCEAVDFWLWVARKTKVHLHRLDEYTCTLHNGTKVGFGTLERELHFLWLQCQGQAVFNVAIVMMGILLFVLSLLGVLHYKRWHLRYFYYVGLGRYRHPYDFHQGLDDREDRLFRDLFISFDDEDPRVRLFLQNVLRPELEERRITYFISEIDFPGHPIKDIIPKVVLGARKTLALFSSHFFPSYERELEFNMAVYHEEAIHRQVIVPVLLEDVDWSTFPPEVMVYLEEHAVVPYRHGDAGFVQQLMDRIHAVVRV